MAQECHIQGQYRPSLCGKHRPIIPATHANGSHGGGHDGGEAHARDFDEARHRPRGHGGPDGCCTRAAARRRKVAVAGPSHAVIPGGQLPGLYGPRPGARQRVHGAHTPMSPSSSSSGPAGTEGDNLVKTRLATGDMNDIFFYNSGSLLQALHPADTLVDLSEEAVHREHRGVLPAHGLAGGRRSTASRPARRWVAGSCTTRRSSPTTGSRCPRRGPSSRRTTTRSRPPASLRSARRTRTRGHRSCSCSPTTTTCRRPCPTSPTQYTGNKLTTAGTPAALAGFQHLAGRVREGLVAARLRIGDVR